MAGLRRHIGTSRCDRTPLDGLPMATTDLAHLPDSRDGGTTWSKRLEAEQAIACERTFASEI